MSCRCGERSFHQQPQPPSPREEVNEILAEGLWELVVRGRRPDKRRSSTRLAPVSAAPVSAPVSFGNSYLIVGLACRKGTSASRRTASSGYVSLCGKDCMSHLLPEIQDFILIVAEAVEAFDDWYLQ